MAPNRSRMIEAHSRRAARYLATSSKRLLWALKKKLSRGANSSSVQAGRQRGLDVGDAVGQGEGDLLHGGRTGLADVIARDRDRVPLRHLLGAVGEGVHDQAHRLARRVDVRAARHVLLQDVVLDGAAQLVAAHALLFADQLIEQQQRRGRRVDRHRRRHLVERQIGQQVAHVLQRRDGDADLAHLALGAHVVGVVTHLGRQVEGARQAGLTGLQEELETQVRRGGRTEAGVLAHRPESSPVHRGLDAAGVGVLPRAAELRRRVEILRGQRRRRPAGRRSPNRYGARLTSPHQR